MYHVRESKYHRDNKWAAGVIKFLALMSLLSFFFVVVGLFMFGFLACSREEKEWEIKG